MLAAWRGIGGFEGRSSIRTWLYRIATNRSLNVLRAIDRKSAPPPPPDVPPPTGPTEISWLQPYPDVLVDGIPDEAAGPAARYEAKEAVALAFVSGLQHLPPRQRAALVLRDVLGFSSAEIAAMLETTEASINSALQRARGTLNAQMPPDRERAPLPRSAREREVVGAFADALQNDDVDSLVSLLADDALISTPPRAIKWQGREACRALALDERRHRPGRLRLVPTRANGQPAFGYYVEDPHTSVAHCHGLLVLTLRSSRISAVTLFDTTTLAWFGLPRTLEV
jgi:RNA polymerase sigma-70 factor (ECF subfamily)